MNLPSQKLLPAFAEGVAIATALAGAISAIIADRTGETQRADDPP